MMLPDDGVVFVVVLVVIWLTRFSLLVVLVVDGVVCDEGEDGEGEGDSVFDKLLSMFK